LTYDVNLPRNITKKNIYITSIYTPKLIINTLFLLSTGLNVLWLLALG